MTMNNPLDILRAFSPQASQATQQFGAGQQNQQNLLNQELTRETGQFNLDQARQQAAANQEALKSQGNVQNTVRNLIRLNTAFEQNATPEQLESMLIENIQNTPPGGNPADSVEALETLRTQGVEGLKNLAGQATAVFQNQGAIKEPEFKPIDTAEGIGFYDPKKGKLVLNDDRVISPAQFKNMQAGENARIAAETKLISDKRAQSDNLRNEVTKLATDLKFKDTFAAFNRIMASNDGTPAGDLALIFNYMKMLDPGSTVREGEFATAENSGGVEDKIRNIWNKVLSGERLTPAQRANFTEQAGAVFDKAKTGFEQTAKPILNIGKSRGLTQDDILGEGYFQSFVVEDTAPIDSNAAQPPKLRNQPEEAQPLATQTFFDENGQPQQFTLQGGQWVPVGAP